MVPEKESKCVDCSEYQNCRDSFASWVFFIVGLLATIAIRVVTILSHLNPLYAKIAWYVGVGGFFVFFIYKYRVGEVRSEAIMRRGLVDKIKAGKQLQTEDYNLLGALLCGLSSKKERINYLFIFTLSALALLLAIYMDFFR